MKGGEAVLEQGRREKANRPVDRSHRPLSLMEEEKEQLVPLGMREKQTKFHLVSGCLCEWVKVRARFYYCVSRENEGTIRVSGGAEGGISPHGGIMRK